MTQSQFPLPVLRERVRARAKLVSTHPLTPALSPDYRGEGERRSK